ncbi:MAG: hypothetical protein A2Z17_07850 [Gammaproteobacteria bacterium RBG_16_66_13]|nr:MAG: hypothetical protein A2Z17_07850 [Gammaproteobacteria bacterium RBG_16_66_13]
MTAKPILLAFITSYFPDVGGAEVALRQIAERLSPEFEFLIVTSRRRAASPRHEVAGTGPIWRLGLGSRIDKWLLPAMLAPVRRRLADERARGRQVLLWGVDITQASLAASLLRRLDRQVPFVLTIQYGEGLERVARGRAGWIGRSFRFMLSQSDRVTAISSPLLEMARAYGYRGPAAVIPNGVDLKRFRPVAGKPETSIPRLITVSRLVPKNAIDVLIRAVRLVAKEHPGLECRVLGDGPGRARLERLALELGVQDVVRFEGTVPHDEVARHLGECRIFVRPSRSEGMGNAFVEAMAAGLPVVGTAVGGLTDSLRDGETGLLAKVDDPEDLAAKIGLLLTNRGLAERLARQGQAWVREHCDLEATARAYAAVFHETLRR